jgi:hypothetical protein
VTRKDRLAEDAVMGSFAMPYPPWPELFPGQALSIVGIGELITLLATVSHENVLSAPSH